MTKRLVLPGTFQRPEAGIVWRDDQDRLGLPLSGLPGWQGNGGPVRGHPSRALPFHVDVANPHPEQGLHCIHMVGVFALWGAPSRDEAGDPGACVRLAENGQTFHLNLYAGRHYSDAFELAERNRSMGDGSSVTTVGVADSEWGPLRVDHLRIDVPKGTKSTSVIFRDLGTRASFVLFDVLFEYDGAGVCPFHSDAGGVALAELASVVRVGDRVRFRRALQQLREGILIASELDEAKGEALTFVSVVCSALLETGGPRDLHKFQLRAAREIDALDSLESVANGAETLLKSLVGNLMVVTTETGDPLVDRALAILERRFAQSLTDKAVASELGLSTSHFRHLFRSATGQPFKRYLFSLRLEKAREMLSSMDLSVAEIARSAGFVSAAHFSRAFASRFSVTPSVLRRDARHT